jgi:predicted AAA+ superfamily ATPase
MDKELIKQLITENQEYVFNVKFIPRAVTLEENGNYVFVGLRRTGKTYLMYQQIHHLLANGISINEILYLNFEDERMAEATSTDFSLIIDCYKELYEYKPIVFLDEVQVIPKWEKFVRRLADTDYRVYVTGSNANLLSQDIATTLGGRFFIQEVYPYSFKEFLTSQGIEIKKNMEYGSSKTTLKKAFDTYFYFGGLPELQKFSEKRSWLNSLYQKIFFGDLIARYDIRNHFALKIMIKKLAESVMHPISYTRLAHIIASTGTKIGKSTVIEYTEHLLDTWLVFAVPNFIAKLEEKETNRKFYFSDNGILNLFLFHPESLLLENLVAILLKKKFGEDLYFYNKNVEVDFYIPSQKWAIQVSYNVTKEETLQREVNALIKIGAFLEIDKFLIITKDDERIIDAGNIKIELIPIWKWLLL